MKKKLFPLLSILFPGLLLTGSSHAQGFDVQQLLLDIQKLSTLKSILTNMQQSYRELDKDYSAVRDVAQGNFDLHKAFLDGLLAVSPTVRNYQRAADIVDLQTSLLAKYRAAWTFFQRQRGLQPAELTLIARTFAGLLQDSFNDLADLDNVLNPGTIRAGDAERLRQIDAIYESMTRRVAFIDQFNNSTALLAAQRQGAYAEDGTVQNLHGINP
ncbi:MAG TPA: TerB family tellurite resistance protein [Puia sp.]|nr:TerB family tellurite resistance protein [Puia sp.]